MNRPTTRATLQGLGSLALATVLCAGCSGGGSTGSPATDSIAGSAPSSFAKDSTGGQDKQPQVPVKEGRVGGETIPSGDMLVRQADMAIKVEDPVAAAARIRSIATGARGRVLSEVIASGTDSPQTSTIVIGVPSASLDATLDAVGAVGEVIRRSSSSQDVKAQYVDTASRLETMKASVERVRSLMSKAEKIGDIVVLEGELSRRQADLEAMEAQLRSLKDAVAESPVSISLSRPGQTPDAPATGFLGGLRAGWQAFTASVVALLTLTGAVLPFLLVALLVGLPLWIWLRRRSASAPAPLPTPGYAAPAASPAPETPPASSEPSAP